MKVKKHTNVHRKLRSLVVVMLIFFFVRAFAENKAYLQISFERNSSYIFLLCV